MKTKIFIPFVATMLLAFSSYSEDGASLFKKNCGVCHSIGNGKLVGPDLKGVESKYETQWLIEWIKSSQTMINQKKDPTAIQVFNDNNKMVMPDQALSDDEIKTVLAFISDETAKLDKPAATAVKAPDSAQSPSDASTGIASKTVIYILIGIIVFLTFVIIGLSKVIKDLAASYKK